jgi:hypothetical protein
MQTQRTVCLDFSRQHLATQTDWSVAIIRVGQMAIQREAVAPRNEEDLSFIGLFVCHSFDQLFSPFSESPQRRLDRHDLKIKETLRNG